MLLWAKSADAAEFGLIAEAVFFDLADLSSERAEIELCSSLCANNEF